VTVWLHEVVDRRDLLLNMIRADLSSRYRTTTLGVLWFILTPLLLALILSVVFQYLLRLGIPDYPLFVLSALLPWTFFQAGVMASTTSVSKSVDLVKRTRIPRIFLPVSAVAASAVHFGAALLVLLGILIVSGKPLTPALLLLPGLILIQTTCVIGVGLIAASANVFYRDVELLLGAGLRALFYLTPTVYPLDYVPEGWRLIYLLNPMAGLTQAYRDVLLHGRLPAMDVLAMSVLTSAVALLIGAVVFSRAERRFEEHL
jgi:ABC-type polysaccharide/polyol phosphate export permease